MKRSRGWWVEEKGREKDCVGRFPALPHGLLSGTAAASFPANCKRIKNASPTTLDYIHANTRARVFCRMCVHLLLSVYLVFGKPFSNNRVRGPQDLQIVCTQYLSDPVGLKPYFPDFCVFLWSFLTKTAFRLVLF